MNTRPLCSRRFIPGLVLVLAAWAGLGLVPAVWGQSSGHLRSGPKVIAAFRGVVDKPSEGTIRVRCTGKDVALGTVVAADGWVLTKHSQLKDTPMCLLKDGREFEATVVSVDERFDLALLKISVDGLKPIEWADSKVAPVGHWVASPGTGEEPVAIGVVSVAARNVPVSKTPSKPAPLAGGPYLGVGLDPDENGAKVSQVMPGSGAEKAGVKVNDVVLSVDGEKVLDSESMIALLQRRKPGEIVKLLIKRGDKEITLDATLGKRPANANRADFQNRLGSELSERKDGFPTILHHDSVIKPTDCGGPLVDLDGKVIGINIARVGRTESNAIPSEAVRPLLDKLMPEKIAVPRKAAD